MAARGQSHRTAERDSKRQPSRSGARERLDPRGLQPPPGVRFQHKRGGSPVGGAPLVATFRSPYGDCLTTAATLVHAPFFARGEPLHQEVELAPLGCIQRNLKPLPVAAGEKFGKAARRIFLPGEAAFFVIGEAVKVASRSGGAGEKSFLPVGEVSCCPGGIGNSRQITVVVQHQSGALPKGGYEGAGSASSGALDPSRIAVTINNGSQTTC